MQMLAFVLLAVTTGLQPPQLGLLVTSHDLGCEITYPPAALTLCTVPVFPATR